MKGGTLAFGVCVATAVAVAGCASTTTTKTVTVAGTAPVGVGRPREVVLYGRIKSLRREGGRFELRFDPAWFLSGSAAEHAAVEDKVLSRGQPVPNDNYVVDEGHRLLTYIVPAGARVTVLKTGVEGSTITVAQLAQLVAGKSPFPRPLFEGLETGFWIRVHIDTVRSLDQQYHP